MITKSELFSKGLFLNSATIGSTPAPSADTIDFRELSAAQLLCISFTFLVEKPAYHFHHGKHQRLFAALIFMEELVENFPLHSLGMVSVS